MQGLRGLRDAYRMRWKRRRLLYRAVSRRHDLRPVVDRTKAIHETAILCFACVRNETIRLPGFLDHHRRLGVDHFLIVDNASDDGSPDLLRGQPDVSLWSSAASYKASRFGMDWLTWLMMRHGHGHWCLTLDADELLIYPHWQTRPLPRLAAHLDETGREGMGALMLDLYPDGPIADAAFVPGDDPLMTLTHFDAGPYWQTRQEPMRNLWVQGGPRARRFFADDPRRAPTLNKLPLMRWHWRHVYANSTHAILPPRLNMLYNGPTSDGLSGILLHTKFLPVAPFRAREEKARAEHFSNSCLYDAYYDAVAANPDFSWDGMMRYEGWEQLERLGLMGRGTWT